MEDTFDFSVFRKVCDMFNQSCLVYHVRNFSYHNAVSALDFFKVCNSTENNFSLTCGVSTSQTLSAHYYSACREVRAFDMLHNIRKCRFRIINKFIDCPDYFSEIVRRNIRCHTYRNSYRTVYKQVRET